MLLNSVGDIDIGLIVDFSDLVDGDLLLDDGLIRNLDDFLVGSFHSFLHDFMLDDFSLHDGVRGNVDDILVLIFNNHFLDDGSLSQ